MRNLVICLFSVAAIGCGGTGIGTDGGGGGTVDLMGARLMGGTYTISGLTAVSDSCMLMGSLPTTTQVTNNGMTLSIGKKYDSTTEPQFNPPGYGLGTGPYTTSSTATLTGTEMATFSDGCTETRTDTSNVEFTGTNTLTVDWVHQETNVDATKCTDPTMDPPTAGCTSEFKFTLTCPNPCM
jgi:hypothetical protein